MTAGAGTGRPLVNDSSMQRSSTDAAVEPPEDLRELMRNDGLEHDEDTDEEEEKREVVEESPS